MMRENHFMKTTPLDLTPRIGAGPGLFGAIALAAETEAKMFDVREPGAAGDGNTFALRRGGRRIRTPLIRAGAAA